MHQIRKEWQSMAAQSLNNMLMPLPTHFVPGLDSLGSVELVNVLNQRLDASLPATLTYNHPSINAIATHLFSLQPAAAPPTTHLQQPACNLGLLGNEVSLSPGQALALPTRLQAPFPMTLPSAMAPSHPQAAVILSTSMAPLLVLRQGLDCLGLVPLQRWDVNGPGLQQSGPPVRFGAFLEGLEQFDNALFGCVSDQ